MRSPSLRVHELIVDNFAGGGGASLGIEWALGRSPDIAVNHDAEAIAMHARNHPSTRHVHGDVWDVDPIGVCAGRPVALAWFSPDCTHHSKAKGGRPREKGEAEKSRALAWVVIRWARKVKPRVIMLENVEEFADWGPLLDDGTIDKTKKGITFRRWLGQLKSAGYEVEMRELRACDYGAPTSRKRLFIIARSDGFPITWPEPTHGPGRANPYHVAAECIEWAYPCPSIFERVRPLADKTLARIARGICKFVLGAPAPFIVPATHGGDFRTHAIDEPFRTITCAHRGELELVRPFIVPATHGDSGGRPDTRSHDVKEPLRTIITRGAPFHLVAPTLIQSGYGERKGQKPRVLDIQKPIGTIIAGGTNGNGNGKHALVSAFLAKHNGGHEATGSALPDPIHTITCRDHHALVTSHMLKLRGTCAHGQPMTWPTPTITAHGTHLGEVRTFLLRHGEAPVPEPIVHIENVPYVIADIGMRMLQPRELFRAQGFPDSYDIEPIVDGKPITKTEQIKMCGNSVCPPIAAALVAANVGRKAARVA